MKIAISKRQAGEFLHLLNQAYPLVDPLLKRPVSNLQEFLNLAIQDDEEYEVRFVVEGKPSPDF